MPARRQPATLRGILAIVAGACLLGCPASPPEQRVVAVAEKAPAKQAEVASEGPKTAADFLPPTIVDEFNPDVTDAERVRRAGKTGGVLRIRNPANLAHLNAITTTGQPERVVVMHLTDDLLNHDPATLEVYPELAHWFQETDLVKRRGGPIEEGRIVAQDDRVVRFIPGAWKATYCLFDTVDAADESGVLQLASTVGGGQRAGRVDRLIHTVTVDEAFAEKAEPVEIALSELDVYTVEIGGRKVERPWAKRNSAFEFVLRDGVRWHDGKPFTSADVIFSLEAIVNPAVEAPTLRPYFTDVSYHAVTRDGKGVKFHYAKPYFGALRVLGGVESGWLVPRHVFQPERFGGDSKALADAFNSHPFKDAPIYTGPYRFASWDRGNALRIERNPDYWKNQLPPGAVPLWEVGRPWIDRIEWVLYQDSLASVKDLESGKLDVDLDVDPTTWSQPETNSESFLKVMTRNRTIGFLYTYIGWNLENPIFRDVETRRALAYLIPRDDIGRYVHKNVAFPVSGPFYSKGPAHDPTIAPIPYDPEEGIRLLTLSGWLDRDGDGVREKWIDGKWVPLRFNYYIHNARDYHQKIADIVKEHVEEAGVDMGIVKLDWTIFSDVVRDKKFDAVRFAWGQTVEADPFQIWHSSQIANRGDNFISYRNARVDEICEQIREEFDPVRRWSLAREMHRIVAEEQPVCFLFGFETDFFIHRELRGVRHYPSAYPHDFTEWWWER